MAEDSPIHREETGPAEVGPTGRLVYTCERSFVPIFNRPGVAGAVRH